MKPPVGLPAAYAPFNALRSPSKLYSAGASDFKVTSNDLVSVKSLYLMVAVNVTTWSPAEALG